MRCPHCKSRRSSVSKTTRPLDEGLEEGEIKRRLRKCRDCDRNFVTFEVHAGFLRSLRGQSLVEHAQPAQETPALARRPLLMKKPTDKAQIDKIVRKGIQC